MNNMTKKSLYSQQYEEEMLMSTKTEKKENMRINDKLVDSTAPKQMPSIWYT